MSTITAKKLNEALAKAKNVGLVEETFILDDCEVTLRNLRPEEYVAVLQACQGLDDVAYLHAYQAEHIARSIVAINGMDLHDTKYVMDEEPDPKEIEKLRPIKLELHTYLLKNVVSTWSKEAVYTAYRKFTDVVEKAERKAKEGVTFLLPEETDEERYRRLLLEAKGCEENLPSSLVDHILDDLGYMRKSTAEEIKAAMEKTDQLAREEEAKEASEPIIEASVEAPVVTSPVAPEPVRQPLNQSPEKSPVDPHTTLRKAIEARQKAFMPVPTAQPVAQEANSKTPDRAAKIAALEADAGMAGVGLSLPQKEGELIPVYQAPGTEKEVVELRKQEPIDPKQVGALIDQPPKSGINPRFRPPAKI
jgi:hypothetical protein